MYRYSKKHRAVLSITILTSYPLTLSSVYSEIDEFVRADNEWHDRIESADAQIQWQQFEFVTCEEHYFAE
jgi:hypothetical protein